MRMIKSFIILFFLNLTQILAVQASPSGDYSSVRIEAYFAHWCQTCGEELRSYNKIMDKFPGISIDAKCVDKEEDRKIAEDYLAKIQNGDSGSFKFNVQYLSNSDIDALGSSVKNLPLIKVYKNGELKNTFHSFSKSELESAIESLK